jgi:hypothetical protein
MDDPMLSSSTTNDTGVRIHHYDDELTLAFATTFFEDGRDASCDNTDDDDDPVSFLRFGKALIRIMQENEGVIFDNHNSNHDNDPKTNHTIHQNILLPPNDPCYYEYLIQKSLLEKYKVAMTPTTTTTTTTRNDDAMTKMRYRWKQVCRSIRQRQQQQKNGEMGCSTIRNTIKQKNENCEETGNNHDVIENDEQQDTKTLHDPIMNLPSELVRFIENRGITFSSSKQPSQDDDDEEQIKNDSKNPAVSLSLFWSTLRCPAGLQFPLHSHPNLEIIICLQGELHEIRMDGSPIDEMMVVVVPEEKNQNSPFENSRNDHTSDDHTTSRNPSTKKKNPFVVTGPNLTYISRSWTFRTISVGQCMINEYGSIHKSFTSTSGSGCLLLCLWSGHHANIQYEPQSIQLSTIIQQVNHKIQQKQEADHTTIITITTPDEKTTYHETNKNRVSCRCYQDPDGWIRLEETFLPDSERRQTTNKQHDLV